MPPVTPRLATSVWVGALLRRAEAAGAYAAVLRKGDPIAGAVILVSRAKDGRTRAWTRVTRGAGAEWTVAAESDADDAKVGVYVARQAGYDPDLWAIELTAEEIQPLIAETS